LRTFNAQARPGKRIVLIVAITAMDQLGKKSLIALARFQIVLAIMIFGTVWSFAYWQGWLFWMLCGAGTFTTTIYFLRHDRGLIERRMRAGPVAETRTQQKLIQSVVSVLLIVMLLTSVLDHRYGWSAVPAPIVIAGDVLIALSFVAIFITFRENSFAAATVAVADGQPVIDTGPYALVRHPMYAGALPMFAGSPLALGSLWGLIPAALLVGGLVWRLLDEERYLAENLPGYAQYQRKVRYRLLPGLW
jgi:protein-S-isoprenylcysteine O-methyltransferase Ste14